MHLSNMKPMESFPILIFAFPLYILSFYHGHAMDIPHFTSCEIQWKAKLLY